MFTPVIVNPLKDAIAESSRRPRIRVLGEIYWEVNSAGAYRPIYVYRIMPNVQRCDDAGNV